MAVLFLWPSSDEAKVVCSRAGKEDLQGGGDLNLIMEGDGGGKAGLLCWDQGDKKAGHSRIS